VDLFPEAVVEGSSAAALEFEPTRWSFESGEVAGWQAGAGVKGLAVRGESLVGTSTTDTPVIHVERTEGLDSSDLLHEVVVRARVSAGANLAVDVSSSEEFNAEAMIGAKSLFGWALSAPIATAGEWTTYRISPASESFRVSFPASEIRHVVIRPTDVADAEFEIESVQLIFRAEHLASIPPGVGWHGLGDIFRETVVLRSPETASYTVEVPSRPQLNFALGTVDDGAATFVVGVDGESIFERTVTTPNRWEETSVSLEEFVGRTVTLSLSVEAENPHTIGFWGAPSLRALGAPPSVSGDTAAVAEALGNASHQPPQGVLFILVDTLRRDHLEAWGYERETAPTVAGLAGGGTLFADAIAQGAWTKVSVPSMLSSTYPTSNGISDMHHRLPASAATLAESFREAGYATWQSSSVPFTGRRSNLHQGVEVLHERSSIELPEEQSGEEQSGAKTGRVLVDRLLPWIEAHSEVPFFALLHAMDPHDDYEPYAPYDRMWAKPGEAAAHEERLEAVREHIKSPFMKRLGLPTEEELAAAGVDAEAFVSHELDWYDGSIRGVDVEIARVLEGLRRLGLEEKTLVVFLSDHGEEFLDHGSHFHEENVYGEMINVPLVMSWPGVLPAGQVVEETVELVDVAPTVLELSGITVPGVMQGNSLLPLLGGSGSWRSQPAISEWTRRKDQEQAPIGNSVSIIVDGWKLIHNTLLAYEGAPEFELFDHRADPLDLNDLAAENPEKVEELAAMLESWRTRATEQALATGDDALNEMSGEELERLRSLGYIQ
jgi:arylsulfatase A-like enzyme